MINNGLFSSSIDGQIYQINLGRQFAYGWPVEIPGVPVSNIVACEIDDDINTVEYAIFARSADKYELFLISEDGKMIGAPKNIGFAPASDPVIIKTGSGRALFVSRFDGKVSAFSLDDMSTLEGWPKEAFRDKPASLRAIDINGDGMEEIIASSDNQNIGYRYVGSSWEAFGPVNISEEAVISSNSYSSMFGTDIIAKNIASGIKTESGPFHHFDQPDDPKAYRSTLYFSPNGDGVKDTADITTQLSFGKPTKYGYYILDRSGNTVSMLKEGNDIPSGTHTYSWDGPSTALGAGGGTRPPTVETYYAVLSAESYMSDQIFATRKVVLDTVPPSFESFKVKNSIFSPNGDGYNDTFEIGLKLSEKCDMYVKFTDKDGNIYKEETLKNMSAFPTTYTWDGKGDDGKIASGNYKYSIFAEDFAGNRSASFEGNASIDMTPYLILVGATPESMSNSRSDARPITFNLKVFSPCTLDAYLTYSSSTVRSLIKEGEYAPGDYAITWEGRDDNGEKLPEGSYNYVFFARYKDVSSKQEGIVRIDNTKPYISNVAITPQEESVKSLEQMADGFTVSFHLSESSIVYVDLMDPQGFWLANILSGEVREAKDQSVNFTKEDLLYNGTYLAGTYTIRIRAVDEAGNEGTNVSARLNIISGFIVTNEAAFPATFTPNNDNHDDFVTFKYRVISEGYNVTAKVRIKSQAGAVVRTFTHLNASGDMYDIWDGKDESGNLCPDGQYSYEILGTDENGAGSVPFTGDLTLISNPTIVVYADPKEFSPNSDGIADTMTIHYAVNYLGKLLVGDSHIAMTIYDPSGDKVYYFADTKSEGSYSNIWDGSNNQAGGYVPDGTYRLEVVSSDPTGTIYSYIADILVDRGPPDVIDSGPSERYITPNGDGQQDETTIGYKVLSVGTQIVSVEVKIYNSATSLDAHSLVRSLAGDVNGDTRWDGRVDVAGGTGDSDGNGYADKGLYKYVIEASDILGNKLSYVSTYEIQVDKVHLIVVPAPFTNPTNRYFSPNGASIKNDTIVCFLLNTSPESHPFYAQSVTKRKKISSLTIYYSGKVTVKVKDASGTTVKTITDEALCIKDITYAATWDGTDALGHFVADGQFTIEVSAVDMIGDAADNKFQPATTVDTVPPVVSFESPAEHSWQAGSFDISGSVTDNISQDCYIMYYSGGTIGSGEGCRNSAVLGTFNAAGLNSDIPVMLIATDEAGNTSAVASRHFNIDNMPPIISNVTSEAGGSKRTFFNPYTDVRITIEANISDESYDTSTYPDQSQPHSVVISAEVRLGNTLIRSLAGSTLNANGQIDLRWNGKNIDGDYVNEGDYVLRIWGSDSLGNISSTYEYTCSIKDDQQITFNPSVLSAAHPLLAINGTTLSLKFITGESTADAPTLWIDANDAQTGPTYAYVDFCLYKDQAITLRYRLKASDGTQAHDRTRQCYARIYNDSFNVLYEDMKLQDPAFTDDHTFQTGILPKGRYKGFVFANADYYDTQDCDQTARTQMWITYKLDQYNRYTTCSSSNLNGWASFLPTAEVKPFEASVLYNGGSNSHTVFYGTYYVTPGCVNHLMHNNEIIYSPGEKRISSAEGDSINPSIATDSTGKKVYVVWEDKRGNGISKIYLETSTDEGNSWPKSPDQDILLASSSGSCMTPSIAMNGNNIYVAYSDNAIGWGEIKVIRSLNGGASWSNPVRITRNEFTTCEAANPSIVCDPSGNAYVAWEDSRINVQPEIYFQKIPVNFAPFSSEAMTTMSMPTAKPAVKAQVIIQSASITPELISPISGTVVKFLRPTFKWYGVQNVTDYRIECAATSDANALAGSMDYFNATISDVSSAKPVCEFTQDEHFMGLDESTASNPYWYWRVQTITSEATTSEVGSFKIELPSSLSGVTNWPNPFDPNKERTKIRYKLGREPESVTIRIYDLTGALVRELDGTTNPEGASVWNKYNDVEWDGRNGRGDMVLNGVYPFEITVKYGSKSVTGRGKIVVLK